MMNNPRLRPIIIACLSIIPFFAFLIMGLSVEASITAEIILVLFFFFAVVLYKRSMRGVKDVEEEKISENILPVLFELTQQGAVIESVTLMPTMLEIEYRKSNDEDMMVKAEYLYSSWGIRGDRVYIMASKPIKDFLGKSYTIKMFGDILTVEKS